MNRLSLEKRTQILKCLVEGNSIRATARICDVVKNTVIKLLCEVGEVCSKYQDEHLQTLPANVSSVMKFGLSSIPKKKMCLR